MVEKKEITNIPGLNSDAKVTILKFTFGIQSDYQNDCVDFFVDELGKNKTKFNPGKSKIYSLVHGIYESESLGIKKYLDVEMGLNESEKQERAKVIRNKVPRQSAEFILDAINDFNKDISSDIPKDAEETIKKQ